MSLPFKYHGRDNLVFEIGGAGGMLQRGPVVMQFFLNAVKQLKGEPR